MNKLKLDWRTRSSNPEMVTIVTTMMDSLKRWSVFTEDASRIAMANGASGARVLPQ